MARFNKTKLLPPVSNQIIYAALANRRAQTNNLTPPATPVITNGTRARMTTRLMAKTLATIPEDLPSKQTTPIAKKTNKRSKQTKKSNTEAQEATTSVNTTYNETTSDSQAPFNEQTQEVEAQEATTSTTNIDKQTVTDASPEKHLRKMLRLHVPQSSDDESVGGDSTH